MELYPSIVCLSETHLVMMLLVVFVLPIMLQQLDETDLSMVVAASFIARAHTV